MIKEKSIAIKTEVKYVCYKKLYSNINKQLKKKTKIKSFFYKGLPFEPTLPKPLH